MINIKICNMSNLEKSFDIDDRKPFSQRNMSAKFVNIQIYKQQKLS